MRARNRGPSFFVMLLPVLDLTVSATRPRSLALYFSDAQANIVFLQL